MHFSLLSCRDKMEYKSLHLWSCISTIASTQYLIFFHCISEFQFKKKKKEAQICSSCDKSLQMNDREKKLIEKVKVIKTALGISDSRKNTSSDNDVNECVRCEWMKICLW